MIGGGPAAKPARDLASIIDRLVRKEQTDRSMNLSDFYQQAAEKVALEKQKQTQPVLQLDSVSDDCRVAVFQTVKEEGTIVDSIKQEVQEVFALSDNKEATVGENGKAVVAEVAGKSIVHACDICMVLNCILFLKYQIKLSCFRQSNIWNGKNSSTSYQIKAHQVYIRLSLLFVLKNFF